jgi:hypothetical protein
MKQEILIILTKAGYCGHCKNFEPIYEIAKNIYKSNDFLKNYNIKFEDYDMVNNDIKNTFIINHNNIKDKIQWYPTVFINIRDTNDKNNIVNEYLTIEHTVIDPKNDEKNQQQEAAKRFLENIINSIKTMETENKITYIQTGGINASDNNLYKKKYLKYKSKYFELKNNLN